MKLHEVVFLFTCVTFQFFYIDLLAEHGTKGTVSLGYHLDIYEEDWFLFWFYISENENSFIQETPIGSFLSTIWVPM